MVGCARVYAPPHRHAVGVAAAHNSGSTFAGFSGDADCTDGSVTLGADKTCTATFNLSAGPDLTGTWGRNGVTQTCRKGTCTLKGTFTVKNTGNATAGSSVLRFVLSADTNVDGSDLLLMEVNIGSILAGKTTKQALNVTLPTGISVTGQFVLGVVDATNTVAETDETNNVVPSGPLP